MSGVPVCSCWFLEPRVSQAFLCSRIRCPEVGLECSLFGVQRSDLLVGSRRLSHVVVTKFLVSRGCNVISMFAFRCPEVGLEFSLVAGSRGLSHALDVTAVCCRGGLDRSG